MKKIVAALVIVLFIITASAQDTKTIKSTTKESCCAKTMTAAEVAKCQAKCKAEGKVCTAKEAAKCGTNTKKCCTKKV